MNTILLLDYDPRSIGRVRAALATRNCHVEVCRDGREASAAFLRLRPTLTLVQDLLPGRHGFEVCREIKRSAEGREHPVVLLAGARPGLERDLPDTGCDGWLFKPFDDQALLALVGRWIDVTPPHRRARPRLESDTPGGRLLDRKVVRVEAPVPVELTEADVMGRLDAILPGSPLATEEPAARSRRASAKKKTTAGKKRAPRKTGTKRRKRPATTAAAG